MYYEEQIINGVLCWRNTREGDFKEYSKTELTQRVKKLEKLNVNYLSKIENLKNQNELLSNNPI